MNHDIIAAPAIFRQQAAKVTDFANWKLPLVRIRYATRVKRFSSCILYQNQARRLDLMGLWVLEDKHLVDVPGTVPLADLHARNARDGLFIKVST